MESINRGIRRLDELLKTVESDNVVYNSLALLVRSQHDLDRILRYETHLSRETDRTLRQLERLQSSRRGYS